MTDQPQYDDAFWEDREATRKVTPIYANRVFVEPLGEGMLRVNFGQTSSEGVDYYTAIVLTPANAMSFANLIYRWGQSMIPPVPAPPVPQAPPAPPQN